MDEPHTFRPVSSDQATIIERIILSRPAKYKNRSHFIRCAIARLIREEVDKGAVAPSYSLSSQGSFIDQDHKT